MSEERAKAEEGEPWFLADDDDAPDLNVQAGISSNLRPEDLALLQEGVGSGPPSTPRDAVRRDRPPLDSSSAPEPGGGPGAPDTSLADPGQGYGASVFPAPDPEAPGGHSDSEPPPTTSVFDSGRSGPSAHSVFEDSSRRTQVYGERSTGDTLAPPAPDLDVTPTYNEPVAAEPAYAEPEPSAVEPVHVKPEPSAVELQDIDSSTADPLDVATEPEQNEPDAFIEPVRLISDAEAVAVGDLEPLDLSTEVENLGSTERVEPAHRVTEPEDVEPGYGEPVEAKTGFDDLEPERPDPAISLLESLESDPDTPNITSAMEPAPSGVLAEQSEDSEELSAPDSSAFSVFETTEPDPELRPTPMEAAATSVFDHPERGTGEGSAEADRSEPGPGDEEPLRSALLQSFKDVVARAPAASGYEDDDLFGLGTEEAPESPEPEEFRPRKPPARPRRF